MSFVIECSGCGRWVRVRASNIKYCSRTCYQTAKKRRQRARTLHTETKSGAYQRKKKAKLVELAGGSCRLCGYNKCNQALEFHHLDPTQKHTKRAVILYPLEQAIKETKKCVLLCANCHREVEAGISQLAEEVDLKSIK